MSIQQNTFYRLKKPSLARIRKILVWADKHGEETFVDMRKSELGLARVRADKSFAEVLELMDKRCKGFFRVILRRQMNLFLILSKKKDTRDILEIGIRGIDVGPTEYFIFIYLPKTKLRQLLSMEELVEI